MFFFLCLTSFVFSIQSNIIKLTEFLLNYSLSDNAKINVNTLNVNSNLNLNSNGDTKGYNIYLNINSTIRDSITSVFNYLNEMNNEVYSLINHLLISICNSFDSNSVISLGNFKLEDEIILYLKNILFKSYSNMSGRDFSLFKLFTLVNDEYSLDLNLSDSLIEGKTYKKQIITLLCKILKEEEILQILVDNNNCIKNNIINSQIQNQFHKDCELERIILRNISNIQKGNKNGEICKYVHEVIINPLMTNKYDSIKLNNINDSSKLLKVLSIICYVNNYEYFRDSISNKVQLAILYNIIEYSLFFLKSVFLKELYNKENDNNKNKQSKKTDEFIAVTNKAFLYLSDFVSKIIEIEGIFNYELIQYYSFNGSSVIIDNSTCLSNSSGSFSSVSNNDNMRMIFRVLKVLYNCLNSQISNTIKVTEDNWINKAYIISAFLIGNTHFAEFEVSNSNNDIYIYHLAKLLFHSTKYQNVFITNYEYLLKNIVKKTFTIMKIGVNSINDEKATACSLFFRDILIRFLRKENKYEFYEKILHDNEYILEKLLIEIFNRLFMNLESTNVDNNSQLLCLLSYIFRSKYIDLINNTIEFYSSFEKSSNFNFLSKNQNNIFFNDLIKLLKDLKCKDDESKGIFNKQEYNFNSENIKRLFKVNTI